MKNSDEMKTAFSITKYITMASTFFAPRKERYLNESREQHRSRMRMERRASRPKVQIHGKQDGYGMLKLKGLGIAGGLS